MISLQQFEYERKKFGWNFWSQTNRKQCSIQNYINQNIMKWVSKIQTEGGFLSQPIKKDIINR